MKIKNVREVKRLKSKFITRSTTGIMQWRYDDEDWSRVSISTKCNKSSIYQVNKYNESKMYDSC